jgi:hypothetical protein
LDIDLEEKYQQAKNLAQFWNQFGTPWPRRKL